MIETPEALYAITETDAQTKALNRLATAIEQLTLTIIDKGLPANLVATTTVTPLAPLPPVRTNVPRQDPVNTRIACPTHGPDKVKVSSKKGTNFYCTGKMNDGSWCPWRV